jgi:macrolide-specific efflux system membrane fusion protein
VRSGARREGNRRRLAWVGGGILAVIAGVVLFWYVHSNRPTQQSLTAVAQIAHIEDTVLASGTIQPLKLVSVGAQASGRIVTLHVALGDHIVKGALVAEIDPSTQRNALQNAQAALDQERAQRTSRAAALRVAELAYKRASTTVAQEASSQSDYETAEAAYNGSKADVAALDAQIRQAVIAVDTARVNLGYTRVVAPIDGTVIAIVTPEGQTVNAVQAAPTIVKLADLETMTVKAQISEADVTRVHAGQKVYFTILGAPERRYEATLRAVEPAPESMATDTSAAPGVAAASGGSLSTAVYYNGLFDIANPDHQLRPAMTAQVNIVLAEADHALVIPSGALGEVQEDGRRAIRILDAKGRAEPRMVQVGINNRVSAQIISGLKAGERVVVSLAAPLAGAKP